MDNYITPTMGIPQPRNTHAQQQQQQQQQHQALNPEQEMQRQHDELRRTVTVIIWTKANVEPLRLACCISTFPYFQLSHITNVVDELGLSDSAFLDTFIPATNQWEQHTILSVRYLTEHQRLIYKLRRSLMESLTEAECPTLREELHLQCMGRGSAQPSPSINTQTLGGGGSPPQLSGDSKIGIGNGSESKNMLKRSAPQGDPDTRHSPGKVHISNEYYMTHSGSSTMVSSPGTNGNPSPVANTTTSPGAMASSPQINAHAGPSPQQQQQQQQENVYIYHQNPVFYGGSGADTSSLPQYLLAPTASAPPIPYHPHPPLKRWPNDYTVLELSQGFHAMDLLISQSPTGSSMTQRTAFERVFGSRYVKSTVCRHRAVWRKAPRFVREQFEQMGTDDRACWGEFVRRVEGRAPGKSAGSMSSDQGSVLGDYRDGQSPDEGDDGPHGQEGVMSGMHSQVPSGSSGGGMQSGMGVYDPSHLGGAGHGGGHGGGNGGGHGGGHTGHTGHAG